jgi:hypothetical protein
MAMGISPGTSAIWWGAKRSYDDTFYRIVLSYSNHDPEGLPPQGRLGLGADLDGRNWVAYNFWVDPNSGGVNGGLTGTMNFVKVNSVYSDGRLSEWNPGCRLAFKNGVLVDAAF